jgi:hypothetical protein
MAQFLSRVAPISLDLLFSDSTVAAEGGAAADAVAGSVADAAAGTSTRTKMPRNGAISNAEGAIGTDSTSLSALFAASGAAGRQVTILHHRCGRVGITQEAGCYWRWFLVHGPVCFTIGRHPLGAC